MSFGRPYILHLGVPKYVRQLGIPKCILGASLNTSFGRPQIRDLGVPSYVNWGVPKYVIWASLSHWMGVPGAHRLGWEGTVEELPDSGAAASSNTHLGIFWYVM